MTMMYRGKLFQQIPMKNLVILSNKYPEEKSTEPKALKDAIQQDENCIRLKENAQNIKLFDSNITPTPSPRIKKRIRREQFLEEHKEIGKLVL